MRLKYTVLVVKEYKTALDVEVAMKNRIFSEKDGAYLPVGKHNGTMGVRNEVIEHANYCS